MDTGARHDVALFCATTVTGPRFLVLTNAPNVTMAAEQRSSHDPRIIQVLAPL